MSNGLLQAILCYCGYAPEGEPKSVRLDADLTAATSLQIDLTRVWQDSALEFVQSIFVDNSLNAQILTVQGSANQMALKVPPGAQAILPISVLNPPKLTFTSTGGISIPVVVFNVPLPAQVWFMDGGGGSGEIIVLLEELVADQRGEYEDGSGVCDGSSNEVFSANLDRKRLLIQCNILNANPIYINFTDPATNTGDSIALYPGGTYDSGAYPCPTNSVNILGTNLELYVAKEMV